MNFEIYAYWNTTELVNVFNAIAAITGSGDFNGLLRTLALVVIIGLAVAVLAGKSRQEDFWRWVIMLAVMHGMLLAPKSNVLIVDRTGTNPAQVVANVPIGLAALAHGTSKIGDWLTTAFETVFSLPPAAKSANGAIDPSPSSPQRDILRLDPAAIQAGTITTSSQSGAIGFAVGVNVFLSMIERNMADAMRTPGVAELSVTVADGSNQRRSFRVLAAANTPETPDALLDGATAKAIEGLVNGVQETRAAKKVGNAR